MDLSEFHFHLPESQIAQQPLAERSASRMLVVDRALNTWEDRLFADLPQFLSPGDVLVLNNSRVIPARLYGHRQGIHAHPVGRHNPKLQENLSGRVEVLLTRSLTADRLTWLALVRPGRKLPVGERITFSHRLQAVITERGDFGQRTLQFECEGDFFTALAETGHIPLPPYIRRDDTSQDQQRYQTVYARQAGSAAAPTAGLHFTPEILDACRDAGAATAEVTLHVGLGTFQPLRTRVIEEVRLHAESFAIAPETAATIRDARRVIGVGTTSVRTVESAASQGWQQLQGDTSLFIYPGYTFRRIDAMLTNFHLPESSLLVLVCALGGKELIMGAYHHAVEAGYRFYSYGDCMLIV